MVIPTIVKEMDCGCVVYRDCTHETHIQYCSKHNGYSERFERFS